MKEQHGTSHGPDRYAVVGSPVAHSLSPVIHGLFAAQTGEDIVYDKVEVSADQFQAFVMEFASGGGCGLNVTVPFKELAHDLCHQLDVSAATAGAVNTLVLNGEHWTGYNTDGIGLVNDLCVRHGQTLHNRRILLLGAGGAARGVLGPLLDKAPAQLWIVNRTASRAEELARHFTNQAAAGGTHLLGIGLADLESRTDRVDVLINATSVGLSAAGIPLADRWPGDAFCYDMSYGDKALFQQWAERHGANTSVDGLGMLVEQAAVAFEIWRGAHVDSEPVYRHLRERVARS